MDTGLDSQHYLQLVVQDLDDNFTKHVHWQTFYKTLESSFSVLFDCFTTLYGQRYDCFYHCKKLICAMFEGYCQRHETLKRQDTVRQLDPTWFRSEELVGMACYVDLFAGDLERLKDKIGYFRDLGISYVHLMPLFKSPLGDSDGGYAISNYREVDPKLGDMNALRQLASAFRDNGIVLVLDFVFNHTADKHEWALRAKQGDVTYQNYYFMFDSKEEVDRYDPYLREIFPQIRRGSFTYESSLNKWVWTTFNSFQWDLNYANPNVFISVMDEMMFLANVGCDVLRLDALAFTWKDMGTDCENRPKAHTLIRLFSTCLSIVAPSVLLKSEAIVHPTEVNKYIDRQECKLSYNPLLMALLWNSVATRKTRLLTHSLAKSFAISSDCSWVNYIRCHDDIGWTFDDEIAGQLGINGFDHRQFLNDFFKGDFPGSFANGVAFGENPENGDCRIAGSLASLCGLEHALENNDLQGIETAVKRMLLLHSVIFSIGGIPLLYYGDELSITNDYSYLSNSDKKHDARWVNRPLVTKCHYDIVKTKNTIQNRFYRQLKAMIGVRKKHAILGKTPTEIITHDNPHIFAYRRTGNDGISLLAIANFSDEPQDISVLLEQSDYSCCLVNTRRHFESCDEKWLQPLEFCWLLEK